MDGLVVLEFVLTLVFTGGALLWVNSPNSIAWALIAVVCLVTIGCVHAFRRRSIYIKLGEGISCRARIQKVTDGGYTFVIGLHFRGLQPGQSYDRAILVHEIQSRLIAFHHEQKRGATEYRPTEWTATSVTFTAARLKQGLS